MSFLFRALLLLSIIGLLSASQYGKKDTAEVLIGTWVKKQDGDRSSIRFVKAKEFEKDVESFQFNEDGSMVWNMPFGCQMPKPNLMSFNAQWQVLRENIIEIDRNYPGEKPDKMKIVKLNSRVLRFVWE